MRVAVVGAGIVGVALAYELAVDGHEVCVFESGGAVAGGASFAHAGIVTPGWIAPVATPGSAHRALLKVLARDALLRVSPTAALGLLPWLWRLWRASSPAVHAANRSRMFRLARYSRERMEQLTQRLQLAYEHVQGTSVLLRDERDLVRARPAIKLMSELGVRFELLGSAQLRAVEPGLNPGFEPRAAIYLPRDGAGNCRLFAHQLRVHAQRLGATFRFQHTVRAIRPGTPVALDLGLEQERFDAVVVCAGVASAALLAPLGIRLPLKPVWGYSVTAPLRHVDGVDTVGPRGALIDARHQVALVRLGQRLRVSGGVEFGGSPGRFDRSALARLYEVLDDWFPGAARIAEAQRWKAARPMLPDGPPVLGAAGPPGVWLNAGHGDSGWTLAAGAARVLADRIAGRRPAIDIEGLGIERLR